MESTETAPDVRHEEKAPLRVSTQGTPRRLHWEDTAGVRTSASTDLPLPEAKDGRTQRTATRFQSGVGPSEFVVFE